MLQSIFGTTVKLWQQNTGNKMKEKEENAGNQIANNKNGDVEV